MRRCLKPEKSPVTGEVHDSGYDCLMEIWWNNREDFEASQRVIASHANPIVSVIEEYDSPMGPNGEATRVELKYGDLCPFRLTAAPLSAG